MRASFFEVVGEYALLVLFFLLFFNILSQAGTFGSRRLWNVLALLMTIILAGSNAWPNIRIVYIYFFALMAVVGKFGGAFEAMTRSARRLDSQFPLLRFVALCLLAALMTGLEFAESLLAPLLQSSVPSAWWRTGSWMIPALGLVSALNDPARRAIRNLFPAANTRLLLFFFVLVAGLLVPLYVPCIDSILRIGTIAGIIIGLIFGWQSSQSTQRIPG